MAEADPPAFSKYAFRIRTHSGTPVDNLMVQARDQDEAERKIARMYPRCEILECRHVPTAIGDDTLNLDNIISQISRQPDDES